MGANSNLAKGFRNPRDDEVKEMEQRVLQDFRAVQQAEKKLLEAAIKSQSAKEPATQDSVEPAHTGGDKAWGAYFANKGKSE
eukprot:12583911-Alexandrium_andersonii.AAC.1